MNCDHCDDTGSLSKDLHGHLDCGYCGVAYERATVERWARENTPYCDSVDAWLLHQHGKTAAASQHQ